MAVGLSGKIGIRKEATFGDVGDSTTYKALHAVSESINKAPVIIDSNVISGSRGTYIGAISHYTASGALELEAVPRLAEPWIGMLGVLTSSVDNGTAASWTHTIDAINTEILPSYFYETKMGNTGDVKRVRGGRFNSMSMNLAVGELLTYSCDVLAKDVEKATAAAVTPALASENRWTFRQATVLKDAVAFDRIKGLGFTMNNNLDTGGVYVGGGGLIEDSDAIGRDITMTFEQKYLNLDLLDILNNFTDFTMELLFVGALLEPGFSEQLKITMPKCVLTGSPHELSGKEILVASSEVKAYVDEVLGYDIQVEIINDYIGTDY